MAIQDRLTDRVLSRLADKILAKVRPFLLGIFSLYVFQFLLIIVHMVLLLHHISTRQ